MKKRLVLVLLLTAAVLAAREVETGPLERQTPPWQCLWQDLMPSDQRTSEDAARAVENTGTDRAIQTDRGPQLGEADDPNRQHPARDWGDDVLVGEAGYESDGRISVDNDDASDDIYVCMLHRNPGTADTAHIWRSTDGGASWIEFPGIIGNSSGVGHLRDAQILCGHGPGDTTWVYIVSAASTAGLRIRRMTPDESEFSWVTIDTNTSITRVAVDRNTENPEHLFVVWTEADGDIRAMSSTNSGTTWANASYVAADRRGASFAAGGDGYGYIAYMDDTDSTYYRVARFNSNLVSPGWEFCTADSAPDHRFRDVAVAADRTAPGDSQVAIALVTSRTTVTDNIYPRYAWTLNGGVSWSSSFWPVTDQPRATWLALFPRIRRSYDSPLFRAIVSMRETTATWDTVVYAYARASSPTTWEERGVFNDYRNTGEVSHDVGYSGLTRGGLVAYREYGVGRVWFDGYNFTGVDASLAPVQPRRVIAVFGGEANLTLPRRTCVSASVYDQDGRLVRRLIHGILEAGKHKLDPGVAEGVCFLRVAVDRKVETAKLVQLR